MPTYVYACDACERQFEQVQSFKDEPLRACLCGVEGRVRRVFQPVGIVFKGSGWYITDSRKSETASVASAANSGESKTESTESKPAEAPASSETKPSTETKPSSETKSGDTSSAAP